MIPIYYDIKKNIFKKIVKLCLFSTINALKRHFSTLFGIPFFSLCCSRSALSILFQRDMKKYSLYQGLHGFRALMDTLIF